MIYETTDELSFQPDTDFNAVLIWARIKSEALADKAVRAPVRRWFMVPMRDSEIVEATHRTNQSTTPPHARNVSGFQRTASAKSKLEQAWRQRVLPQKGHGIPVNLFRPQNGVGRFHCTATRATTSSSNSPTKARTGAEMPDLSRNDGFAAGSVEHSPGAAMTGGAFIVFLRSGRAARKIAISSIQAVCRSCWPAPRAIRTGTPAFPAMPSANATIIPGSWQPGQCQFAAVAPSYVRTRR